MHSSLVRVQNVFGFFTTVSFFVAALVALSVLVSPQDPSASIELRNVQVVKGRPHYDSFKREEFAHIRFDLDADFSSLFNWNTKQLFVYILATYPSTSPSSPHSQAIIWDTIIPSHSQKYPSDPLWLFRSTPTLPKNKFPKTKQSAPPTRRRNETKPGIIHLSNSKPKYQINDISGKLAERGNVTLEVGWNVQPWVGALTWTMWEGHGWGRWKGVKGGRSKIFEMPALKGKVSEKTVVSGEGKPDAAGAKPVLR